MFKFASVLMIMFAATSAQAGLLFEPHAGYTMGNLKFTGADTNPTASLQGTTQNGSIDGFAFGARAGWMFGRFFLGGEYQAARASRKMDGSTEAVNWTNSSVYGIVGLQSNIGLRISAGMTVTPHVSEESSLPERTTYTGSAQKVSVGFRYKIPVALNVDYIMYKFDKYKQGTSEGDIKERFSKMDYSALLLSISFPFEIGNR